MSFWGALLALLWDWWSPLYRPSQLDRLTGRYADWVLSRSNAGTGAHGLLAWTTAALMPAILIGLLGSLFGVIGHWLELFWGAAVLSQCLGFRQIVRSAGASAQLLAREGEVAQIRLPSGEVRRVSARCMATVGQVSNLEHENQNLGKAGRARHLGQRPETRGVAMTPRDHPHGGGEGKSPTGMPPKTPWGKPAMGYRTRRSKTTDRLIVRSRHRK